MPTLDCSGGETWPKNGEKLRQAAERLRAHGHKLVWEPVIEEASGGKTRRYLLITGWPTMPVVGDKKHRHPSLEELLTIDPAQLDPPGTVIRTRTRDTLRERLARRRAERRNESRLMVQEL